MVGLYATGAVNNIIISNPEEALAIAAGLAAVGGSLTLRHVFRSIGLRDNGFNRDENLEIDLLDEQAPGGFWHQGVTSIHAGLVAAKMAPALTPRFRWFKGMWRVDHGVNVGGSEFEVPVPLVDLTTVNTPILKGDQLG